MYTTTSTHRLPDDLARLPGGENLGQYPIVTAMKGGGGAENKYNLWMIGI